MPLVDQCRERKVACGFLLNDIEKEKIRTFSDAGLNRKEIAKKIGRSTSVVANFLRAPGKRENRRITMMASNSTASLDEIRSIYCPIMRKCPTLRIDHKKARMDFAYTHMPWTSEWIEAILRFFYIHVPFFWYKLQSIQILFNEKKKFNFDGTDRFTSHWRDLRKERIFFLHETLEAEV
uniref:HTH_Tnp_Tc3_1 domain-containing protein n=1 Tax=Heterorhabditis bacteriophora TaxID=37862 RepID=A0A1I7WFM6_HETBA